MLSYRPVNTAFLIISIVVIGLAYFAIIPFWTVLIVLVGWLFITALGSFNIRWNYFLTAFHHDHGVSDRHIAITFDDGPHPEFTPKVLAILERYNAKATFFCIGKQMEELPDLVKEIDQKGHTIGQHSYSHKNGFGFFNLNKVLSEIKLTNKLTNNILNKKLKLFRPPFGVTNPAIAKAVKRAGLTGIGWEIRSLDTVIKNPDKIYKRIIKRLRPGAIILLHDTNERCPVVLEQLLQFLKRNGYKSMPVDQLLKIKAYE